MERRTNIRYQMNANAIFMWKGPGRAHLRAEGMTRDISPQGAFIFASSYPPVDTTILVDIYLFLSTSRASAPKVRIRAEARVLRIDREADQGMNGFAIGNSHFRFWPPTITELDYDIAKPSGELWDGVRQRAGERKRNGRTSEGASRNENQLFPRAKLWT
jgi:PilZ domain